MQADLAFRSVLLASAAGTLLSSPAFGQDFAATNGEPLPVTAADGRAQTAALLPTVSVTATRSPMEAFDYPGMVTVIGRGEMDRLQPASPGDVLRFVPNVEFLGGPRRTGEVSTIRGFSGPDVIVLLDGTRQNFGSAHDERMFIAPSLLTSAEVLRGPASSLYGSGGPGGVIELRTLKASDRSWSPGIRAAGRRW